MKAKNTHRQRRQPSAMYFAYIVLILISIIWLFPFVGLVLQSFRSYATRVRRNGGLSCAQAVLAG